MFVVSLVCFMFVISASFIGASVSGTQTVVGALLGAGSVATTFSSLAWKKMISIVGSWFASPAVSIVLAFILMSWVTFVMSTSKITYKARIYMCHWIGGFCFTMMAYLFNKILNTGKSPFDEDPNHKGIPNFLGY